ncbi:MAG: ATP-dependent Clp protease ATP-binding subunit [Lachnospiraceae bacterium]
MLKNFTDKSKEVLRKAKKAAQKLGQDYVGTEHILIGLLQTKESVAYHVLENNQVTEKTVVDYLLDSMEEIPTSNVVETGYSPSALKILESSIAQAQKMRLDKAGTEHILIALCLEDNTFASRIMLAIGASVQKIYVETMMAAGVSPNYAKQEYVAAKGGNQHQRRRSSMLEAYSVDVTEKAFNQELDPLIGRVEEVHRVLQTLSRRTKNNPCLVGEPGVGKTAIVEGIAQMIVAGNVPDQLKTKHIYSVDLTRMVAGSKYRGEFEERIKGLIDEAKSDPDALLFIDEIHTIIGAGGAEGAMDASNILKPSLSRGEIQLIGATTREEYRKYIEKDSALERRFQPIVVEEPTVDETIEILNGLKPKYEEYHNVVIRDDAICAAAQMAERYINDRFLPDKAIDLMDEAGASIKMQNPKGRVKMKEKDIAKVVSTWTKIPLEKISRDETARLRKLESILHKRVVGQEEAVAAVAKAVRRGRVGLKDPNRPIGSFLFLGPTGVGKTELSKALAEAMFGTQNAMIRVDMSEYMEKHSVSKMIGSPPGYVGHEEGGQLSEKVRRNPYSVILFDEIEKAHEDVFNILLQVLDDGHITDSQGRKVSFKNTIVIMTSNVGAQSIMAPKLLGFSSAAEEDRNYERMKASVMEEVKRLFKPEFINRIDEIQVFHMLKKEDLKRILDILLTQLKDRMKQQMGIELQISTQAKTFIMEKGYDEKYGARPLRRAILTEVEDRLADAVLDGTIKESGNAKVVLEKGMIKITN